MSTPLPYKVIIMIRNRERITVNSHLVEFATRNESEIAITKMGQWGGCWEFVRLYDVQPEEQEVAL